MRYDLFNICELVELVEMNIFVVDVHCNIHPFIVIFTFTFSVSVFMTLFIFHAGSDKPEVTVFSHSLGGATKTKLV